MGPLISLGKEPCSQSGPWLMKVDLSCLEKSFDPFGMECCEVMSKVGIVEAT